MKKILYSIVISCLIIFLFFSYFYYKKNNIGNNISRKSEDKIVQYILNNFINYEAQIDVTVYSNKTVNKYNINQVCNNLKKYQEINEPQEIQKMYINLEDNKLTVGNSRLDLKKVYENYSSILNNSLFLNVFIEEYKKSESIFYEKNNMYVMEINIDNNFNTYCKTKKLYINKETIKPEKLEIYDNAKNKRVCIIYNYIEIK